MYPARGFFYFKWLMFLFNSKNTTRTGSKGEIIAEKYLLKNGYTIVEKNFKNNYGRRLGEIDIIAKKDAVLFFIEVKTRFSKNYVVLPEENIGREKLFKLNKIIQFYLKTHNSWDCPYQIDAISVLINKDTNSAQIKHLKNIFF
ncbi:MAG: hypothetical protein ACD_11C00116G0026 [uncultured bacterium]|nr:MAG: hypothetical protein ACD_11C00116G0026 [uncultured bacterium]